LGVNLYIVTMAIWKPSLEDRIGPKYRAISQSIAADIADGRLASGERLPPQRELAWALGVTVGTVSRAYADAERAGLVKGEVGRGTYVLRPGYRHQHPVHAEPEPGLTDLTFAFPPPGPEEERQLADALRDLSSDPNCGALLDYQPNAGTERQRAAGAQWMARVGMDVSPQQVVQTAGAQHAILVALSALTRPGDRVVTECLTYSGVKSVAATLGLRLEGLPMDEDGVIPGAFEDACKDGQVRVLYCIPTGQNPTTAVMPIDRRKEIAEIARRHDVSIIEDDILAYLFDTPPAPIATFAPERSYYITSLSKTIAPGLRVGYIAAPAAMTDRLSAAIWATCWTATPITTEIAARWIESGAAERILDGRKREIAARLTMCEEILPVGDHMIRSGPIHLWLQLPDPWRANDFATEARRRHVAVTPAESFAVGRNSTPHAVRICFGMPRTRDELQAGLETISKMLMDPACAGASFA
jgi:DNA-binding transcriptional MocR family regulator